MVSKNLCDLSGQLLHKGQGYKTEDTVNGFFVLGFVKLVSHGLTGCSMREIHA